MKRKIRVIFVGGPVIADRDGITCIAVDRQKRRALVGRLLLSFAWLVWCGFGVSNAQETSVHGGANFLPSPLGEALTLVPKDMPEIDCAVLKWKNGPPAPTLAILCPPQNVFAPLHVYLKLSWLRPEDVPSCAHEIATHARSLTKIRTNQSAAWVWLDVQQKPGAPSHKIWVAFDAVEDFALLNQPH
jgi:hypothetical protein